jgi:hypothetical protein
VAEDEDEYDYDDESDLVQSIWTIESKVGQYNPKKYEEIKHSVNDKLDSS